MVRLITIVVVVLIVITICDSVSSSTDTNKNPNANSYTNSKIDNDVTTINADDSMDAKVNKTAVAIVNTFKRKFDATFHDVCDKYSFVNKFYRSIDHPSEKYVVFVYHEHGLKNGGFGDRIAGLLNAASLALRFNRTLLVRSMNGFDKLFKPKYEVDPNDVVFRDPNDYTYHERNWTSWTKYNSIWENNGNEELDLDYCINCHGKNHEACGLDNNTEVSQHSILLTGNRAYICKWATHPDLPAHQQLQKGGFDLTPGSSLFQQGACLLRLSMWPTDYLWENVKEEIRKELLESMSSGESLPTVDDFTAFRIGVHFRCGDHSYTDADSYNDACVHDVDGTHPHEESAHMRYGTPWDLGRCANAVIQNYTSQYQKSRHSRRRLRGSPDKIRKIMEKVVHLYIASDSHSASIQISTSANHSKSAISPHGCHVEIDQSEGCQTETIVFWLLLAMSDVMITQTDQAKPISAFSRYAALYGLQKDPFRDSLNCNDVQSIKDMGWKMNGNWYCLDD